MATFEIKTQKDYLEGLVFETFLKSDDAKDMTMQSMDEK